jgi:hypothetical protein
VPFPLSGSVALPEEDLPDGPQPVSSMIGRPSWQPHPLDVTAAYTKLALPLAVLAPVGIHLIFGKLLRVPLPPGLLPMPW